MNAIELERHARTVVLVTGESPGTEDHVVAVADVHMGKSGAEIRNRAEHGTTPEWSAAAIDAVNAARERTHEDKKVAQKQEPAPSTPRDQRRP
jgi:hypothetical protein